MVSWREQPTRYDIEAVHANTRRVGLVIRIRWALLIVLVVYSVLAGLAYTATLSIAELASRMLIPALALLFVVVYNTFYQLNYKRFGNIAVWNNLQLTLDAIVVTVLVYYSGGVSSWFWSMYSLFILEAAFILPTRRGAWFLAVTCMVLLGIDRVPRALPGPPARRDPVRCGRPVPRSGLSSSFATCGRSRCSRVPRRSRHSSSASSAPRRPSASRSWCSTRRPGCTRAAYFLRALRR